MAETALTIHVGKKWEGIDTSARRIEPEIHEGRTLPAAEAEKERNKERRRKPMGAKPLWTFMVAILVGTAVSSCGPLDGTDAIKDRRVADDVLAQLRIGPAWSELPYYNDWRRDWRRDSRTRIMAKLEGMRQCDLDVIRDAIEKYVSGPKRWVDCQRIDTMSHLYVLNKYLFQVPETVPAGSVPLFGRWLGLPADLQKTNLLWPLSHQADGTLVLTGRFGGYVGADYKAMQAFDYYREKFGRRNFQATPTKDGDHTATLVDKAAKYEQVATAAVGVGPKGATFWSDIANSDEYNDAHRRLAVVELLKRHVSAGISLESLRGILDSPTWLKDSAVAIQGSFAGAPLIVGFGYGAVFTVCPFPNLPGSGWQISFWISDWMTREDLLRLLRGQEVDQHVRDAKLLEIAIFIPGRDMADRRTWRSRWDGSAAPVFPLLRQVGYGSQDR